MERAGGEMAPLQARCYISGMSHMSEWREWDFPPDRHRASRRHAQPVLDLDIRVERNGAGYLPTRRSLGARFMHAYARVMIEAIKIIFGVLAGLAVAIAIMFLVAIIRA
jgi:hypothetical protein